MWGRRRGLGSEEQSPRDRSDGRMRHVTKYLFWKTAARQNNLNGRLSPLVLAVHPW
jgi:hypothetical protein